MWVRVVTAAGVLICGLPTLALAQAVRGRVLEDETGQPITGVQVQLLNDVGTRVGSATTDSIGSFHVPGRGPGDYSIRLTHIAYEDYTSPKLTLPYMETAVVDIRMSRSVIPLEPISVHARLRTNYHAPTYDGLYARMRQLGTFGLNRVVMKDDMEMRASIRVQDLLRHWFPSVFNADIGRGCHPALYWDGHVVDGNWVDILLDTSVEDVEAIEVYEDPLIAPMPFRGSNILIGVLPCAVVAVWPLRPDLPGRHGGRTPEQPR